jgi:hypothetical protein
MTRMTSSAPHRARHVVSTGSNVVFRCWAISLWWSVDPLEYKINRAGIPPRAVDVPAQRTIDRADVRTLEASCSGDELAGEEGHVVHAAQHTAVGRGGDAEVFVIEPAESVGGQVLGGQLSLNEAHDHAVERPELSDPDV